MCTAPRPGTELSLGNYVWLCWHDACSVARTAPSLRLADQAGQLALARPAQLQLRASTPAINEGCTRSLRISHTSRRAPLQPVPKTQVPCTPYHPPNRTGVLPGGAVYQPHLSLHERHVLLGQSARRVGENREQILLGQALRMQRCLRSVRCRGWVVKLKAGQVRTSYWTAEGG